jgi:hypothetical protein
MITGEQDYLFPRDSPNNHKPDSLVYSCLTLVKMLLAALKIVIPVIVSIVSFYPKISLYFLSIGCHIYIAC